MSDASITLIELSIKLILFICFMTLFSQRREGIKSIHMLCQVLKSVYMRKPGRIRQNQAGGDTNQITNFAQTWHKCWVWRASNCGKKLGQNILFPLSEGDPMQKWPLDTNLCIFNWPSLV